MKEQLEHLLRQIAQGRPNAAEELADILAKALAPKPEKKAVK